jgi:hypothetical protein
VQLIPALVTLKKFENSSKWEMVKMLNKHLIKRLPKERAFKVGISGRDLEGLSLTEALKADILSAINSTDATDVRLGFFFAKHFLRPGQDLQFDQSLLKASLALIETSESGIKDNCVTMLILLGRNLSNYRSLMLDALPDSDPMVRQKAIHAYQTYTRPKEFGPLERFEQDDYATEIGMGSHLIYELRNMALEKIETVVNRKFKKIEKTEIYKGNNVVFWWDWEPFHKWKNGPLHKLGFV